MLFGKGKMEKDIMFDMERIGRNLMVARKNAGMTQMELADRMGISFQAVSNWERGVSCPDIAKLSELSELLGVTIDSLLGNERAAEIVREAEKETPVLTREEFESVAPLLNQEQADRAAEGTSWDIGAFASAIPFLSGEFLSKVAKEKHEETGNLEDLVLLYPFLPEQQLYAMAKDALDKGGDLGSVSKILPFLRVDHAEGLATEVYRRAANVDEIYYALPFVSAEYVKRIAKEEIEKNHSLDGLQSLFPFMNGKDLEELIKETLK